MTIHIPLERTPDGWLVSYAVQSASSCTEVSGPYTTRAQAERARAMLAEGMPDARVVRRGTQALDAGDDPAQRLADACASWARMLPKGNASAPEPAASHHDTASDSDAYDTATLHLEKAETLVALLVALDGTGAQQNLSAKALGCTFVALSEELASVRAALRQYHQRGDA
ncbi:hypothetical protein OF001_U80016 [Pseudomonas sp. OF001]|uniref:hypothetical protein n=1 Tax=Pseudomonas sp. OF001 TaxID=2772300 RepID=UPI00191868F8|nr:hypothetical protein [Pseudomonas sp. OF001]CAD5379713.1 hypothetical protein OF001_U80016 [Pseudomonas sp. OF001]